MILHFRFVPNNIRKHNSQSYSATKQQFFLFMKMDTQLVVVWTLTCNISTILSTLIPAYLPIYSKLDFYIKFRFISRLKGTLCFYIYSCMYFDKGAYGIV